MRNPVRLALLKREPCSVCGKAGAARVVIGRLFQRDGKRLLPTDWRCDEHTPTLPDDYLIIDGDIE